LASGSPDPTSLDFFMWGYVKYIVCAEVIHDLHLQEIIYAVVMTRHASYLGQK
jgi:hypothetical protein